MSLLLLIALPIASASSAEERSTDYSKLADTVELIQTQATVLAGQRRDAAVPSDVMDEDEKEVHNEEGEKCETAFTYSKLDGSYSPVKAMSSHKDQHPELESHPVSPETKVIFVSAWLGAHSLLDLCWMGIEWLLAPWRLYLAGLAGWLAYGWLVGAKHAGCPPRMILDDRQWKNGGSPKERQELVTRMKNLRATYHPSCAFPRWVVDTYAKAHFDDYDDNARQCAIFYDAGDNREDVLLLATQREPVNIAMRTGYKKSLLKRFFGWSSGRYCEMAAQNPDSLPPNIAIMCLTPVVPGLPGPEAQVEQMEEMNVFVLSVIAYGFHSSREPDQMYFLSGYSIKRDKKIELRIRFGRIFDKIFAAAIQYKRTSIIMPKFGATESARKFPGHLFNTIWMPAFQSALEAWAPRLKENNVKEVSLMGGGDEKDFNDVVETLGFESMVYGNFPALLYADNTKDRATWRESAMFVNDWDPHAFIGNGNFADNTIGGHFGRTTALSVLGWPITNPYLKSNMSSVARPGSGSK